MIVLLWRGYGIGRRVENEITIGGIRRRIGDEVGNRRVKLNEAYMLGLEYMSLLAMDDSEPQILGKRLFTLSSGDWCRWPVGSSKAKRRAADANILTWRLLTLQS